MTDSTDELMRSYEVIRSIVMRHSQYDAARILTLNLATCYHGRLAARRDSGARAPCRLHLHALRCSEGYA